MPFETIANIRPVTVKEDCSPTGVIVRARKIDFKSKRTARWIEITLGRKLPDQLVLRGDRAQLELRFGNAVDAGKIAMSVDVTAGGFQARKSKSGTWRVTINAESADGLFALEFPTFTADTELRHSPGQPPCVIFKASEAMLAAD